MQHQVIGDDIQAVVLSLNPGEAVRAEAGAMHPPLGSAR